MNRSRPGRGRALLLAALLLAVLVMAPARVHAVAPVAPGRAGLDALRSHEDFVDAFQRAVWLLHESERTLGPLAPVTLADLHRVGAIAFESGDLDIASDVMDLALEWRRRVLAPSDLGMAESLCDVGLVGRLTLPRERRTDFASAHLDDAFEIANRDPVPDPRLLARIVQGRANVMRSRSLDAAIPLYERALAIRARAPSYDRADNLTWLGWTQYQSGRHAEALDNLGRAEAELRALGADDVSILGSVLERRTDALLLAQRWPDAEDLAQRTAAAFERARVDYLPGFARAAVPLNGYDLLALAQIEQGKYAEAWESTERFRGNVALDFVTLARARTVDPVAYAALHAARTEWTAAHAELDLARLRAEGPRDTANWTRFLRRLDTQARIFVLERDLLLRMRPPAVAIEDVQQALPPGTAFLSFLRAGLGGSRRQTRGPYRDVLYLCVLRRDRPVQWVRVWDVDNPDAQQRVSSSWRAVDAMRARAAQWRLRIEPDPAYDDSLRALGRVLFDPVETALAGIRAIVAEYPLSGFPLEHLRDSRGRYLLDRFAFTYVPSATVFRLLSEPPAKPARNGRALVVGDPRLSPEPARGLLGALATPSLGAPARAAALESLAVLPRLVHSADEVRGVAKAWKHSVVLTGGQASESALAQRAATGELEAYRALHFATHFITDARPQRVAIALTPTGPGAGSDGVLTAREIGHAWELNADLVTLGGCLAARGALLTDGSEFVGLTQALYGAGARSVVASLWEVDDEATALLLRRFHSNWTGGMPAAVALTEARKWLRDLRRGRERPFAHPVYWAGFVLTGVGD